jgi:hypothetical protein
MLEAAGGGGAGTDWWSMPMERIQQLAQSPDIDAHYQIVDGWQKSAELVGEHMFQVQQYRESLAAAWPPGKSSAAAAYITRLDTLIKHLNETYEAALSNHEALSSASLSLGLAKTEVNKIYSQWDNNNKALLAYNQQQDQKKAQAAGGKPTPSPSPSGEERPPVTAEQQEALRQKAVTLMSGVSSDLAQAQLKVVRPAPYSPDSFVQEKTHQVGSGANGAPTLPPIVPAPYSGGGSGGSTGGSPFASNHGSVTFPTTSNNALPGTGPTFPSNGGNPGLVLGGTNPPPPPPPTFTPNPGLTTSAPSNVGPSVTPGIMPPGSGPAFPKVTVPPGKGGLYKPFGGLPEGGLKPMPPGGIIGRTPGGALGEPAGGRLGPQRVNPVGGVIGEANGGPGMMGGGRGAMSGVRGGGTGRGGMRTTGVQQPYGQAAGRRSGQRRQSEDTTWDPDNPWATDEGVDPVVVPSAEQPIDPGPAIGLD